MQDLGHRLGPADELWTVKAAADLEGMVDVLAPESASDQTIGQRRELPGKELGALAIDSAEVIGFAAGFSTALEVHHADGGIAADRSAEYGLDLVLAHAVHAAKARVRRRRRGFDGLSHALRLFNDSPGDGVADRHHIGVAAAMTLPPPGLAAAVGKELEIALAGACDVHDQRESLLQERLDLMLSTKAQEVEVELALTGHFLHCHAGIHRSLQSPAGRAVFVSL